MITKFKIFEKIEKCQIWVIPLKMPDFIISLKKIGMNKNEIDNWIRLHKNKVFTEKDEYPSIATITIKKQNGGFTWFWYPSTKEDEDEYTEFMGKLEIEPKEIQNYYDEIEFQKNIKQYNL